MQARAGGIKTARLGPRAGASQGREHNIVRGQTKHSDSTRVTNRHGGSGSFSCGDPFCKTSIFLMRPPLNLNLLPLFAVGSKLGC